MVFKALAAGLFAVLAIVAGLFVHPQTQGAAKIYTLFYGARVGISLGFIQPPEFLVQDESFSKFSPELVAWRWVASNVVRRGSEGQRTHADFTAPGIHETAIDGVPQQMGSIATEMAVPPAVRATPIEIPSTIDDHAIECDLLLPAGVSTLEDAKGAIVTLHGGCHVRGSRHGTFNHAGHLANATGLAALNIRQRLLPTNTVEQHIGDVVSTVDYLGAHGIPAANVVLYGCSAGANLAILAQLKLLESDRKVGGLLLNSPGDFYHLENDKEFPSHVRNRKSSMLSLPMLLAVKDLFGPEVIEKLHWIDSDYTGFPPVYVNVGEYDVIVDHGIELGKRMDKFGVDVTVRVQDGGGHCPFVGSAFVPEAREELRLGAQWVNEKVPKKN